MYSPDITVPQAMKLRLLLRVACHTVAYKEEENAINLIEAAYPPRIR